MAILAAQKIINLKKILDVIEKIKPVEGRFENIGKIKNKSKIILDYAHTPEALKTCLLNLREQFPDKKLCLLFGCGGNRDQNKRSKMGKIASHFADNIILTNDNPRFEAPEKIVQQILEGIDGETDVELDRRRAIATSIIQAEKQDIVLIAGKGHETGQIIGDAVFPLDDAEQASVAVAALEGGF